SPITSDYLANINQVTSRTTRNDVKNLNAITSEYGAAIHTVMGKGYQLEIKDDHQFRHFIGTDFNEVVSDNRLTTRLPHERKAYRINRFLISKCYIKLDNQDNETFNTKSNIQND